MLTRTSATIKGRRTNGNRTPNQKRQSHSFIKKIQANMAVTLFDTNKYIYKRPAGSRRDSNLVRRTENLTDLGYVSELAIIFGLHWQICPRIQQPSLRLIRISLVATAIHSFLEESNQVSPRLYLPFRLACWQCENHQPPS